MPCEDCGSPSGCGNVNPLDCNNQFMQCNNPCGSSPTNTPACESLPSQIANFTTQFFGSVVKTEINGKVSWSLPCSLDVGLPANPRGVDEGLACYFLRLFQNGITGLKGDPGKPGKTGARGLSGFTVVHHGFVPPSPSNPLTQFHVVENPFLVAGIYVFIEGSGYYQVTDVQPGGVVFATLIANVTNPVGYINAGAIVTPTGGPGLNGTNGANGAQGPAGPQGPQGVPGLVLNNFTGENGMWSSCDRAGAPIAGLAVYPVPAVEHFIDFTTDRLEFFASGAFTYLVTGMVSVEGLAAVTTADTIELFLTENYSVPWYNTIHIVNNIVPGQIFTVPITAVVTTSGLGFGSVSVLARASNTLRFQVNYVGTHLTWVRIA